MQIFNSWLLPSPPSTLMQFLLLFPLIIIIIIISSSPSPAFVSGDKYHDCTPMEDYACGKFHFGLSYPFYISPDLPEYCGYPGFELTCLESSNAVTIQIKGKQFVVRAIDSSRSLLSVVQQEYYTNPCPLPRDNVTLDESKFEYYPDLNQEVMLFITCSSSFSTLGAIPCLKDSYYWNESGSLPNLALYQSSCRPVETPVNRTALTLLYSGYMNFWDLLLGGFALKWTAGMEICGDCMKSKGRCGFNISTNKELCFCEDGSVGERPCSPPPPPPTAAAVPLDASGGGKDRKDDGISRKIGIGVGVVLGALLIGASLFLFYKQRMMKKRNRRHSLQPVLLTRNSSSSAPSSKSKYSYKNDSELSFSHYRTHVFTYQELEDATDGFSPSRELGEGGFGTVYKGTLRDGRVIAVKRLYENKFKRVEQFMNEVDILSGIHHPNLVILYGCTSRHSRELLLVYEYAPNGTVADHLHGSRATKLGLPLSIRLSIAIETAGALHYLHAVKPQIIHRDVKTDNILLDNDFRVKVADFGLSRLFPINATHVSTAPQGTPGYVDPEYHMCYQLTDKSDVYSFGVVLAELISSMPAVDVNRHRSEINLANMLMGKLQSNALWQMVDPRLGYQTDSQVKKTIDMVAEIAFKCLQAERDMRPSIKQALDALREIRSGGLGTKECSGCDEVVKQDACLLKNQPPHSPASIMERWTSVGTTPSTSG